MKLRPSARIETRFERVLDLVARTGQAINLTAQNLARVTIAAHAADLKYVA